MPRDGTAGAARSAGFRLRTQYGLTGSSTSRMTTSDADMCVSSGLGGTGESPAAQPLAGSSPAGSGHIARPVVHRSQLMNAIAEGSGGFPAARDTIPATYALRDYVAAGRLMSYATDFTDSFRQVGVYTG
jgi:hypothetical protein